MEIRTRVLNEKIELEVAQNESLKSKKSVIQPEAPN